MHVIGQTYCVGPFGVELTELCCKCKLASDHFQDQPQLIELNRGVCSFRNKTDRELPCNEPTSSRGTPLATPCLPHWQKFPLREYWCPLKHVFHVARSHRADQITCAGTACERTITRTDGKPCTASRFSFTNCFTNCTQTRCATVPMGIVK